uniref:Putative ovule protein n=1 Tax=Solanum chacoense TaxID=4108 RepID=A0A0V0HT60_SOLCH
MALCALKICFRNSFFESRVYRKPSLNPHKDRDKEKKRLRNGGITFLEELDGKSEESDSSPS